MSPETFNAEIVVVPRLLPPLTVNELSVDEPVTVRVPPTNSFEAIVTSPAESMLNRAVLFVDNAT